MNLKSSLSGNLPERNRSNKPRLFKMKRHNFFLLMGTLLIGFINSLNAFSQEGGWQNEEFGKSLRFIDDDNEHLWVASGTQIIKQNKTTLQAQSLNVKSHFSTTRDILSMSISDAGHGILLLNERYTCDQSEPIDLVLLYSDNAFDTWMELAAPLGQSFVSAYISNSGVIYCAMINEAQTETTIYRYEAQVWEALNTHLGASDESFKEFFGNVYYRWDGIYRIDSNTSLLEYDVEAPMWDYAVSSSGDLWYAYNGLHRLQNGVLETFNTNNSALPSNSASHLSIDNNNFVWVTFFQSNFLFRTNGFVSSIHEDVPIAERLLFHASTSGVVYALDISTEKVYYYNNGWNLIQINSNDFIALEYWWPVDFCRTSSGAHWVSGYIKTFVEPSLTYANPVLYYFNNEEKITYSADVFGLSNQTSNSKIAIDADTEEALWLGCENGLWKFENQSWQHFNTENSNLPSNVIIDLDIDAFNNLWVLTDLGLFKKQGEFYVSIGTPGGEPDFDIARLVVLNNGSAWIHWSYNSLWFFDGIEIQEATGENTPIEGGIVSIGGNENQIAIASETSSNGNSSLHVYKRSNATWSIYNPISLNGELGCIYPYYFIIGLWNNDIYLAGWHSDYAVEFGGILKINDFGLEVLDITEEGISYNSGSFIESGWGGLSILHRGRALDDGPADLRTAVSYFNDVTSSNIERQGLIKSLSLSARPIPNPKELIISSQLSGIAATISCKDLLGRILFKYNSVLHKGENYFALEPLEKGAYVITVNSGTEEVSIKTIWAE
jgi:ligand-binding sensor domain-containing protein